MIPRSWIDSKSALLWTPLPLSWSLCPVGEIQHPRPTQQWFNQLPTGISTIRAHISNFVESDNAGQLNKTDSRGNIATGGPCIITKIKSRLRTKFLKPKNSFWMERVGERLNEIVLLKAVALLCPYSPRKDRQDASRFTITTRKGERQCGSALFIIVVKICQSNIVWIFKMWSLPRLNYAGGPWTFMCNTSFRRPA